MTFGDNIPFHSCDEKGFLNLVSNEVLPVDNEIDFVASQNNFHSNDVIPLEPSCRYYDKSELHKLNKKNKLNIFHNNINGLENKFEILNEFLTESSRFDIVAISETSEKEKYQGFLNNINMTGYSLFSSSSKTNKGGVALYIRSIYNFIERVDLKESSVHFESVWVEIKNKNSKNILCASIYRHPHNDNISLNEFFNFMEKTLSKIAIENKDIYICGDFNFDLLKISQCDNVKRFFELMGSFGLINQITIPTRTTEHTATIIDNIF